MNNKISVIAILLCLFTAPLFTMEIRSASELQKKLKELRAKRDKAIDDFNRYEYAITHANQMRNNQQLAASYYNQWLLQHPDTDYEQYYTGVQDAKDVALDKLETVKDNIKEINEQIRKLEQRSPSFKDVRSYKELKGMD